MIQEFQLRVTPRVAHFDDELLRQLSKQQGISRGRIKSFKIVKRSVDARQRDVFVNVTLRVCLDKYDPDVELVKPVTYSPVDGKRCAVVVGMGPGGLFAALRLMELGIKPIVIERGKNVLDRRFDIAKISRDGVVNPNSNYAFGEGGAGAYSDGKLYTRSKKRGSVRRILNIFCQHGASENILVDAHPHIGSDKLPGIISNMRKTIIENGGEVYFDTLATDLVVDGKKIVGVATEDGREFHGAVILATGHSARDVYRMLHKKNIAIESKGIAVGVRLEHPQHMIDAIQYHSARGRGEYLPAAEYSFVRQIDGRGVYSFCMCPGGVVVPAASDANQLVVNGMSPSNRGTYWANSGMVVELRTEDLPDEYRKYGELEMMAYQEALENRAYLEADSSQVAGAQRMMDFVTGKDSRLLPPSSYAPGIQPSRLDKWLPPFIATRLQKGFSAFGRSARGFLTNDAIVIGVETRTSSPIRIPRDRETLSHIEFAGLYPCGEGAGYAGGIVSSAIDGERCAESLAKQQFNVGIDDRESTDNP